MSNQNLLKIRRQELGLTMKQVADAVGVSEATVSRWESGEIANMRRSRIVKLASILNLSPLDLMNWEGEEQVFDKDTRSLPSNIMPMPKMVKKPLLGTIACGVPILAVENIEAEIDVPDGVRCDFVLRCKGDSMVDARIYDGDLVYLRQQEEVENGEIAAILIDDGCESEATLKRVYLAEDRITLFPANQKYEPLVYVREEMNSVRIIGKAVAFTSMVR